MTTLEGEGTSSAAADADPPGVLEQLGHPRGRRQTAAVARMLTYGLGLGQSYPAVEAPVEEQRRQLSASVEPVAGVLARRLVARSRVAGWMLAGAALAVAVALTFAELASAPSAQAVLTIAAIVAIALLLVGVLVLRYIAVGAKCERDRIAGWLATIAIVTAAGEILARRARESAGGRPEGE